MANLGELFSAARQQLGLPLDEVARRTRIRADYIAALEQNQFNLLPGDVYARGFVRNYALLLGIPVDDAISAYEESAAKPRKRNILSSPTPARRAPDPIRIEPLSPTPVDTRLRYAPSFWLVSAFAVVLLIGFYFAWSTFRGPQDTTPTPTTHPATPTSIDVPVVMVSNTPVRTPWPTPGGSGVIETQIATDPAATQPVIDPGTGPTATVAPDAGAPTVAPTVAPTNTPASSLTVEIEVRSSSNAAWVQVQTDGTVVFAQTLAAGERRAWTAQNTVQLRSGRADIVWVVVNGVEKGYLSAPNQYIGEKRWNVDGTEEVIR